MANPAYASRAYRKARTSLLRHGAVCAHCGAPATESDHQPPLSRHAHVDGTDCCRLVPSCFKCGRRQGAILAGRNGHTPPPPRPAPKPVLEPVGWDVDDPIWDRAPWLAAVRAVPAEATWPRLMSPPHPQAVDSYGDRFAAWERRRNGKALYWWQQLAATRLLEHDAAGMLVWDQAGVTVARQVGKSWLLRALALWRIHHADLFDEPQDVVHTAKDLPICLEVQAPARRWARQWPEQYKVRESNGSERIEVIADGSRWLIRAYGSPYGWSASMAIVDEAWAVPAQDIEEGLLPTMVEKTSPQLVMFSTAHRKATTLMMGRRAGVLADLTDTATLWLEWSAPPMLEPGDETGWRAASPHWHDQRRKMIAGRLAAARSGVSDDPDEPDPWAAFNTQWLNRWPATARRAGKGEALFEPGVWEDCEGALAGEPSVIIVAVDLNEDGSGAAAFVAGHTDGRFEVDGRACQTASEALELAAQFMAAQPRARLIHGASLAKRGAVDERLKIIPRWQAAVGAGSTERNRGLVLARSLVLEGRLVHDRTADLDAQVAAVRVAVQAGSGLVLVNNGRRRDLINCMVWALDAAHIAVPVPQVH